MAVLLIGILAAPVTALASPPIPQENAPPISEIHKSFLSTLVRRTLRDKVLKDQTYEPSYVPSGLNSLKAEVVVRLRQSGRLLGAGAGGPIPIAGASRNAALGAIIPLIEAGEISLRDVNEMLVEIEVVGPPRLIDIEGDWTEPRAVDPHIEPGVHGFVFRSGDLQQRFCPTEVFTSDMVVAEALTHIAQQIKPIQTQVHQVKLMCFRTTHWYEPRSGVDIVSLHRGLIVLEPEYVTRNNLSKAIDRLAEYMIYRQKPSGLFSYQYEPAADRYTPEENFVRQAGSISALAYHARVSQHRASKTAARLGIEEMKKGLVKIPALDNAAFIATPDRRNKLGVTALLCMSMAYYPDRGAYAAEREKMVNAMLWLQRTSGMFITAFPPAEEINAQDYFPGEALLAMAMHYEHEPSAKVMDAFDRAIGFYRLHFRNNPSPAFVPWQSQAYAYMAGKTGRKDYVDYVFELTDYLAAMQLTPSNCKWPEMWGGIASYQEGRAGVSTAAYLEGFADALTLARRVGDVKRAKRYEEVVRLATRFVLQLQMREEEAYFVRSHQDAVGGIRTSPSLNLLRIDHCQHALIGLMKAREALYSTE